jgi:predicted transcriptional regulator
MNNDEKKIYDFLLKIGLNSIEAKIYLCLISNGNLTTLEVSRLISYPRTSICRVIENLKTKGIVEEIIDHHRTYTKAVWIDKLENILKKKEKEILNLKTIFPDIASLIKQKSGLQKLSTKVLYYRGKDGMKQMLWNTLRTKDLFRGYSYTCPVEVTGQEFALEWAMEYQKRDLCGQDFYSDNYIQSAKNHPYPKSITWDKWESKYIKPEILNIDHQVDIYNDVVAYYSWQEQDIFGVEIYNQNVANLQKQIFDALWKTHR